MPITKQATLVSNSGTTWFSTMNRQDAVNGAILGTTSPTRDLVQNISMQFPSWPDLEYYPAVPAPNPQYVWDDTAPAGPETRWFAQAFQFPTLSVALTRLATAEVFSDNANTLFIEEYLNIPIVGIQLVNEVTPVGTGATDGSLSDAGQAVVPPFGWQTISKFSRSYVPTLPTPIPLLTTYFFVVSFAVVNYSPVTSVNPAGLQYIVELYNDLPPAP